MGTRWKQVGPGVLEITHTNHLPARAFGLLMFLAGTAFLIGGIGGQLRKPDGLSLNGSFLGLLVFALGFVSAGLWMLGYRGVRRLDVASDTYHESDSVLGIGRRRTRRLSDFKRVILVTKPPVTAEDTRIDYDLFLFASRADWTVLLTTHNVAEAGKLGRAAGALMKRSCEELSREKWDDLAA